MNIKNFLLQVRLSEEEEFKLNEIVHFFNVNSFNDFNKSSFVRFIINFLFDDIFKDSGIDFYSFKMSCIDEGDCFEES